MQNPLNKRKSAVIARLNITAVESKFFLHPFICLAKNTEGRSTAYIQLIHPGKQHSCLFEMQFCFPVVRFHDLEVYHAISSAQNALRFLLTWGLPFLFHLPAELYLLLGGFAVLLPTLNPSLCPIAPLLCMSISILVFFT